MKESMSLRHYCGKCKGYQWMVIENNPPVSPFSLRCNQCKTRYEKVKVEAAAEEASH